MNRYKREALMEFLNSQMSLLVRPVRNPDDLHELLMCFGLDRLLPRIEQIELKRELFEMIEANAFMDRLRAQLDS